MLQPVVNIATLGAKVWTQGNQILVVEELEMICSSSRIGKKFARLIHLGRHRRVGILFTARRIADCHKLPISQAHHLFLFRTHLPNDILYLKSILGLAAEELPKLPEYHFAHWDSNTDTTTIMEPVPYGTRNTTTN